MRATKIRPRRGLMTIPSRNHPKPDRPRDDATMPTTTANSSQKKINSI
jgi:hypothetical protein